MKKGGKRNYSRLSPLCPLCPLSLDSLSLLPSFPKFPCAPSLSLSLSHGISPDTTRHLLRRSPLPLQIHSSSPASPWRLYHAARESGDSERLCRMAEGGRRVPDLESGVVRTEGAKSEEEKGRVGVCQIGGESAVKQRRRRKEAKRERKRETEGKAKQKKRERKREEKRKKVGERESEKE